MNIPETYLITTFLGYFVFLLVISAVAWHYTKNLSDFILGGRRLGEWTTALSAGASDMSGWLLLGLPGYAYLAGFEAIWIALGLFIGTWINWKWVAPKLRYYSEIKQNSLTIPELLEQHFDDHTHLIRIISALFILFFFIFYTSAGLVAGGKLFESVFTLPYLWAVGAGTLAILIYTTIGGFLAVSWTDLFQGLLMVLALIIVAHISLQVAGNWTIVVNTLELVDPSLVQLTHQSDTRTLSFITIISLLGWGLGYFGQPHILARFMAIDSVHHLPSARRIAIIWTGICLFCALLIGFTGVAVLETPLFGTDSEKVFIELVAILFHPVIAGICLAAILAAIMSTADSQLLVASAVFTRDIYQTISRTPVSQGRLVLISRVSVIITSLIAFLLAITQQQYVLELVGYAWAGLGATLGPVLVLMLYWEKLTREGALAGIIGGGIMVIIWHQLEGGIFDLYEIIPAFITALIMATLTSLYAHRRGQLLDQKMEH